MTCSFSPCVFYAPCLAELMCSHLNFVVCYPTLVSSQDAIHVHLSPPNKEDL